MPHSTHTARPTIGVLAGWQYYWTATPLSYLNPIYRGIRQAAQDRGCNLLLGCGMGPSAATNDPLRPAWPVVAPDADFVPIGPGNTSGLVVVNPLHSAARSNYIQAVIASGHPVVFIGSGEQGVTCAADNGGGILAAMRHLVEHGHRRIAFIAGSPDDLTGDSGARLDAYRAALAAYGLVADPRLVAYGQHVAAGGQAAMQTLLAAGAPFTAVLASNDESALGAMVTLKAAGLRIPQDVAVIGFDDRLESVVHDPPLSSVRVPLFQLGYQAVELLLAQLAGEEKPRLPVLLPTQLVRRASCGCGQHVPWPGLDSAEPIARGEVTDNLPGQQPYKPAAPPPGKQSLVDQLQLANALAVAVQTETQGVSHEQLCALAAELVAAFVTAVAQGTGTELERTLAQILHRTAATADDLHAWQTAISLLYAQAPQLLPEWSAPATQASALALVEAARRQISTELWRQHRRYVVAERWMVDRLGLLTAHLLTALDESQVYQVLAQHLPEMGIDAAWVAEFSADGEEPAAQSHLRTIVPPGTAPSRFPTHAFPPQGLAAGEAPFSLALLPLVGPRGQLGCAVFDTAHLDLYGAIAQQLAAALHTAQLYREATEGRRLAEEANLQKSRFLSTVSHELRTPLNLIVGLSGILLQEQDRPGPQLPAATRQDIERIYASAQHLGGLIGDVIDLASSDAGQLRLSHELVDLGQALSLVAAIGRPLAQDKRLAWHAEVPVSGPWVWGDRTRLRQVALNLVSNAIKFTARGEVSLSLTTDAQSVTVLVRDTGLGIPPAEQARIFTEFWRSERSVVRGYGGLGLGLAICQRLVALHGGTLGVWSTGEEGAGSTFYFTLPTVAAPGNAAPRATKPGRDKQRVLVLSEQDAGTRQLQGHLRQRGFQVEMAQPAAGPAWQARLIAQPPSAVVLDISQANEQSWAVLKGIKDNPATRELPVLLYAGLESGGTVLELDYLTKPIAVTELTRALDQRWLGEAAGQPGRTFLVVDDDPDTLAMHARIVQAHGATHRVLQARNGREALAILAQTPVDLVLLDLMMPELDGFGVLAAMRERPATREIPVIVVTGQTLTEAEMARLNQGVATVLGKGLYSLEETLAHLETALARKHKLSGEAQRLVRKAMVYLHAHYAEPLTRRALAEHVGLDEDYLTWCFRQELGMTPIAYLNRYRVNQAKELLKQTNKSVTAIALAVGFSDSGYFSRVFRREVGVAPEIFRRTPN